MTHIMCRIPTKNDIDNHYGLIHIVSLVMVFAH